MAIFAQSCPTAGICVGVNGFDLILSTNPAGGPWSTAYTDHFPSLSYDITSQLNTYYTNTFLRITGVSCPSASLCVAIDGLGKVIVGRRTSTS
jgi:hypothetical protein